MKNILQKSICGIIVTYNPSERLIDLASSLSNQVDELLLVDNHSTGESQSLITSLCHRQNVQRIQNDTNRGIAAALNQGLGWASSHGYQQAVLFDQDSQIASDTVTVLMNVAAELGAGTHIAVIGSNLRNVKSGTYFASEDTRPNAWRDTEFVLTSGSLIPLDSYLAVGPFREEFFIDSVDSDYCYRAISKGYRVIQSLQPTMEHSAGHPTPHRFLGRAVWTVNHSPQRCYYMMRNPTILIREYAFTYPRWAFGGITSLAKWIFKLVCFEDQRGQKLRCIALGLLHGLTNTYQAPPL